MATRFRHIAVYNLTLVANQPNVIEVRIAGITDATGHAVAIDIRISDNDSSTLLLALSSPSGGIVLSISGSDMVVTTTISDAQSDALRTAAPTTCYYSLRHTPPSPALVRQLVKGAITYINTATP